MSQELFATNPNFVQVVYRGPKYARMVKSPTGVLLREHGLKSYGLYTEGAVLYVHKDDVAASPNVFVPINPVVDSFTATRSDKSKAAAEASDEAAQELDVEVSAAPLTKPPSKSSGSNKGATATQPKA